MNRKGVLLLAAALAAVVVAVVVVQLSRGKRVDEWIGRQVVGITNAYLVPQIDFETLRYTAPAHVTLTGVTLTAPDGTVVFDAGSLAVGLAAVPRVGQPIQIQRLDLGEAHINLVRDPATGGFRGLDPIVRVRTAREEEEHVPEQFRLSNVLRLREIRLSEVSIVYDAGDGSPPMELRGVTADLDIRPDEDADEPGWYSLAFDGGRAPGLECDIEGHFNLDTFTVDLDRGQFRLTVDSETISSLPPEAQALLREHDAAGSLEASVTGRIPLQQIEQARAEARVSLRDFSFALDEYRLPIDRLLLHARLSEGVAQLEPLEADLLAGRFSARGSAQLKEEGQPARLEWTASDLNLNTLLRTREADEGPPRIAGLLSSRGSAEVMAEQIPGSISGSGTLQIRDGRLVMLPGLSQLADLMDVALGRDGASNHRADAEFDLTPEGISVTRSEIVTNTIAARGTGLIGYDGALDMRVNAGPMERLQSALGVVGEAFGAITDRLMSYRVTGTVAEPRVGVRPLQ